MDRVSLIYRVLSGEASPDEKKELDEWVTKSEANQEEFEDIKLLWENSPLPSDTEQDEAGFEKIRQRIQQRSRRKKQIRSILYACIVITLAVLLFLLFRLTWFRNPEGIQFNDTGMNEVIKMLENEYQIQIEVNNPQLLQCHFTATLYKIKDKQTTLQSIEHSLDVAFISLSKRKYSLVGDGCSSL
ncbi:MAG: DUF4974 domain-containing protein [Bacteroidota bacterium]|jgi:ferric-dicitrate binding protein FerR (iron transport regulator)